MYEDIDGGGSVHDVCQVTVLDRDDEHFKKGS